MLYLVKWEIEVDAISEREAAVSAREIMRDRESSATIFEVSQKTDRITIDLSVASEGDRAKMIKMKGDRALTQDGLRVAYGNLIGGYPYFPKSDWRYLVENGDTVLGYWKWVENQIEEACSNAE